MIISISANTFDPSGSIIFPVSAQSDTGNDTRRVSRISTLDGKAVLVDSGIGDSDKTMVFEVYNYSATIETRCKYLQRYYSLLYLSMESEMYSGTISQVRSAGGILYVTFLVKEKIK